MSNISDIIEQFILQQMDEYGELNLSRNELANFFSCAPSQINYVLSTRFNAPAFLVESRRGGGGYIKLSRVKLNKSNLAQEMCLAIGDEISYVDAVRIVKSLINNDYISDSEYNIILSSITDRALINPLHIENKLRANILKNILINISKGE